jgi:hypothetical protein
MYYQLRPGAIVAATTTPDPTARWRVKLNGQERAFNSFGCTIDALATVSNHCRRMWPATAFTMGG